MWKVGVGEWSVDEESGEGGEKDEGDGGGEKLKIVG